MASATTLSPAQRLTVRAAAQEAVTRVFVNADRRDWDALAHVLAETVDLDYSALTGGAPARISGSEVIEAWRGSLGGFDATQHLLGSFLIDVLGSDEAGVRFYGQATHLLDTPHGERTWTIAAHYEATVREQDGWRVNALTLHLDWAAGNQQLATIAASRGSIVSLLAGRAALVTGGARGIGLEVCRQLGGHGARVWLTARRLDDAEQAAAELRADSDVLAEQLDVCDEESVLRLARKIPRLDILVNNAAIDYDDDQQALAVPLERVHRAMETNLFGAWRAVQAFANQLRSSSHGRVVNVSSQGGQLQDMGRGGPGYRLSKLALNGLTRMLAAELAPDGVLVNSVCPGWTDTDMGRGRQTGHRRRTQRDVGMHPR